MSIAELVIKHTIGKINIDFDPLNMTEKIGVEILNFSSADVMLLGEIPLHHKDPFDRMIIAQSIANELPIMTDDPKFRKYECDIF